MAIGTHITLPTTPFGGKLQSAAQELQNALDGFRQLKGEADAYTGGGVTPANLENVAVGIPAGDGAAVYTDIANVLATINVATVTNAINQLLG